MGLIIGKFINGQVRYRELEDDTREYRDESGTIIRKTITANEQFEHYRESGWKLVENIDDSQMENKEEFYSTLVTPVDKGDTIGFTYQKRLDKRLIQNEIRRLKDSLTSTDYKVIKCYEASLLSQDLPYNMNSIHSERQDIRDRINELEAMIKD